MDLASPSHPLFFEGLLADITDVRFRTSVRRKTETAALAREAGFEFELVGRDFDNVALRTIGVPLRTVQLGFQAPSADVSLSARNAMCVLASRARGMPSIHFSDNDITAYAETPLVERLFCRFRSYATRHVVPSAFRTSELTRWGVDPDRIHTYDGYKEDIYVANFEPDESFTEALPFDRYVVVRPEALGAAYVDESETLVPALLRALRDAGTNVVYLPRRPADRPHAEPFDDDRVYVPDGALNGLQLAWHSDGMLTGSGTMAREAACMGKPAVSFFPGPLLSVDRQMVADGMVFHSRDPDEIVDHLAPAGGVETEPDLDRSIRVRREVSRLVRALIDDPIDPDLDRTDGVLDERPPRADGR
ncbi:hypothetical protein C469_02581 [Halorubrum lipolyticum DSM 21995]|uniref:DUF354 domain-containing protein n=1 Tax=Halorubrum lipolyticum DSM 21995 TaxID=1227482 RepID=M0P4F2_9EURY|nr:hypothetical protein C469_02581 [Halorubrum lipolyticum DSM 21995]